MEKYQSELIPGSKNQSGTTPEAQNVIDSIIRTKLEDPHNKEEIQKLQQLLDKLTGKQ